jgi:hypothetical protein
VLPAGEDFSADGGKAGVRGNLLDKSKQPKGEYYSPDSGKVGVTGNQPDNSEQRW